MNKKIIAAAIAASFVAPAAMAADTVVYGKLRQSIDLVDMGSGTTNVDNIQVNDKTSRLGFKGSEDLGNGLKAVFQMEFGIAVSSSSNGNGLDTVRSEFSGTSTFSARNAFVGLAGDFGTVLVGRHDHPLKISTGSLDLFSDSIADNNNAWTEGLTDFRADGTVAYVSPSFSGLTVAAALVPGENSTADGLADAYSVAAMYSNGGIYASVAYEEGDKNLDAVTAATDYEQTRVGLGYTMDAFTVNVVWANVDSPSTANAEVESVVLSGKYTMGNNAIKAKYFNVDRTAANTDSDGWALGLEHNFSKRTQAQVVYVTNDVDGTNKSADGDVFSLQLNHNF